MRGASIGGHGTGSAFGSAAAGAAAASAASDATSTPARAARAQKGDAGFWTMHDLLFTSQSSLEDDDLERAARDGKLDVPKAMAKVKAKAFAKGIDEDVIRPRLVHRRCGGMRSAELVPFGPHQPDAVDALERIARPRMQGLVGASPRDRRHYLKDGVNW